MVRYLWIFIFAIQFVVGQQAPAVTTAPDQTDKVAIVLYSDFQCPYCKAFSGPIREVQAKGIDGMPVDVVFKQFPLSFHPDAQLAAQGALAAGEQGKFWEMHDLLFANQPNIRRDDLLKYAAQLNLDLDRFKTDMDSDRIKERIKQEQGEGEKRGVDGTPGYFINGKQYSGTKTLDELTKLVAGDRRRKRALAEISDNLMSEGPSDAPVTLEFFADLESPVSVPALSVVEDLMKHYPNRVRLQFRNFPLAFHPLAPLAHDAAMAAARQGHFWEFVTYILAHQDSLREQDLIAYAGSLGMDAGQFADVLQQQRYIPRVEADVEAGLSRGIRGSPVVFVNSKRIDGVPSLQMLTEYVEAELAAKK